MKLSKLIIFIIVNSDVKNRFGKFKMYDWSHLNLYDKIKFEDAVKIDMNW